MTRALHKLLYEHIDKLADDALIAARRAVEDLTYLENNEDFLYFTVSASAWGYDADADASATEMGLDKAILALKREFERHPNGPTLWKGAWESGGQIRTFHVYVKLAHSVVEIPPSIYQRRLPEEMKPWVKRALDYKVRQEKARRSRFG